MLQEKTVGYPLGVFLKHLKSIYSTCFIVPNPRDETLSQQQTISQSLPALKGEKRNEEHSGQLTEISESLKNHRFRFQRCHLSMCFSSMDGVA